MSLQTVFSADEPFAPYNKTELLQICRDLGMPLHPLTPREEIIEHLLGQKDYDTARLSEMNAWRHGIMGFLLDHWDIVSAQLTCPARSGDPLSCFQCIDQQVMYCLTEQRTYLTQIKRHKKEEEKKTMEQLTVENCPRDLDLIEKTSFIQLRRVISELGEKGFAPGSNSEENKAFYTMKDVRARAEIILNMLLQYDEQNPGTEDEAATASKKPAATKKREPATSTSKATGKSKEEVSQTNGSGATQIVDLAPLTQLVEEQKSLIEAQGGQIQDLGKMVQALSGVVMVLAENNLQGPAAAYLAEIRQGCADFAELSNEIEGK